MWVRLTKKQQFKNGLYVAGGSLIKHLLCETSVRLLLHNNNRVSQRTGFDSNKFNNYMNLVCNVNAHLLKEWHSQTERTDLLNPHI